LPHQLNSDISHKRSCIRGDEWWERPITARVVKRETSSQVAID